MGRLFIFLLGLAIFSGCLVLSGYCYENAIEVGDWLHDLVGFMELPLFGIVFVMWMLLLLAGLALMGADIK